jgi:hypothetical protein
LHHTINRTPAAAAAPRRGGKRGCSSRETSGEDIGMKSLEDIRSEFLDQLKQKDSELLVEVHRARDEKDALL